MYTADVRALQQWLRDVGFHGHCMVTEWNYSAVYPPLTEAEARLMAAHYLGLVQGQVALVHAQVASEKVSRVGHILAAIVTGLIGVAALGAISTGIAALSNGGTPAAK